MSSNNSNTANSTSANVDVDSLRKAYAAAGQDHVFAFYDKLSAEEQRALVDQLSNIDVERVNRIFSQAIAADSAATSASASQSSGEEVLPLPDSATASIVGNPTDEAKWRDIGLDAIAQGTVAVLLLAGGQGTRLGSALPKGMYDIDLPSHLSLFELQAGRIKRLKEVAAAKAGKDPKDIHLRWYIMTSGPTRKATEEYMRSKAFFGLDEKDVVFFEQGKSRPFTYHP